MTTPKKPAEATRQMGRPVSLGNTGGDLASDDDHKWVHVATEGVYLGYLFPFAFTPATFGEMILNVRAHPSFEAGVDGVGVADVIPWDFEHATKYEDAVPVVGVPAQGWTSDLQTRVGPDGKLQLWAYTRFLETAREYINSGQYKWASVSADLDATDPHTSEQVGALVFRMALTNIPFIEGMTDIAASKGGKHI